MCGRKYCDYKNYVILHLEPNLAVASPSHFTDNSSNSHTALLFRRHVENKQSFWHLRPVISVHRSLIWRSKYCVKRFSQLHQTLDARRFMSFSSHIARDLLPVSDGAPAHLLLFETVQDHVVKSNWIGNKLSAVLDVGVLK